MAPFCFGLRLNARYRGLPYLRVQQILSGKRGEADISEPFYTIGATV
jgi:hypothetical protein